MGMLLGLVLFMNMLGSLLFVPAALSVFKPKAVFSADEVNLNFQNTQHEDYSEMKSTPGLAEA